MKTSMRKKRSPIRCSTPESRALFLPVCQKANPASTASTSVDTRLTQISIGCRSARRQWRAESESSCIANETGAHSRRAARTRRPRQPPASAAGSAISSGGVALPASARSSASILSTIAPLGSASASSSASAGLGEIWASRGEAPSASNHCARAHEPTSHNGEEWATRVLLTEPAPPCARAGRSLDRAAVQEPPARRHRHEASHRLEEAVRRLVHREEDGRASADSAARGAALPAGRRLG